VRDAASEPATDVSLRPVREQELDHVLDALRVAGGLYRSLGYDEIAVYRGKAL
jgi:hypothetical protein